VARSSLRGNTCGRVPPAVAFVKSESFCTGSGVGFARQFRRSELNLRLIGASGGGPSNLRLGGLI
jgi:hypothetical protein